MNLYTLKGMKSTENSYDGLRVLFKQLQSITQISDIGYHKIKDGKLNPIYKNELGSLALEEWKKTHDESPVYIKKDNLLLEIMDIQKTIAIQNTKLDSRSPQEFFIFNIYSHYTFPVIEKGNVAGIVILASIGKVHELSEEQINKCEELIEKNKEYLL